jgi:hypothetical protein
VKNVLAVLVVLAIACNPCAAQKPAAKHTTHFNWNWQDVQYFGDQTIATSKDITADERAALLKALVTRFKGVPNPREAAAQTRIKVIQLGGNGAPEIATQPFGEHWCSPTGNCALWLFQKNGAGHKLILEKGAAQGFTVQSTRTNGFSDLVLTMHGSATEKDLYVYQFRDGQYRRAGCYEANWTSLDKDGTYRDRKDPEITPCAK